jgi:hypothetical protein
MEMMKRRAVADTGPRDESRAHPEPPSHGQGFDWVRRMKICVTPDGKKRIGVRLGGIFCDGIP